MTKHYYRYFVSYYYMWRPKSNFLSMTNNPYQPDFGYATFTRTTPIETDEDILNLSIDIAMTSNKEKEIANEKVIIISFQLMKEYDEESED